MGQKTIHGFGVHAGSDHGVELAVLRRYGGICVNKLSDER